ncbi:hypothetical protein Tco_1053424 [Tanacetum coccineum]
MLKVKEDKRNELITDGSKVSTDEQVEGTEEHNEGTEEIFDSTEEQRGGTEEKVESTAGQTETMYEKIKKGLDEDFIANGGLVEDDRLIRNGRKKGFLQRRSDQARILRRSQEEGY